MINRRSSILVTGGLGNLGSWITDYLVNSNRFDVSVLSRSERSVGQSQNYKLITCDLSDYQDLNEAIGGQNFDYVVHLASVNDTFVPGYGVLALSVNTLGTRNLLEVLRRKIPKKLIYFSTFHVYGQGSGVITEDKPVQPLNDYAITHYFAEEYVRMYHATSGIPYIIFRLSNSYGCPKELSSSKWYLLFNDLCRTAFITKEIKLKTNGRPLRDFIYMNDVCKIIKEAIDSDVENEVFNLGTGSAFSLLQVAEFIQQAFKEYTGQTIPVQLNQEDVTDYPQVLEFRVDKLQMHFPIAPENAFVKEAKAIFSLLTANI